MVISRGFWAAASLSVVLHAGVLALVAVVLAATTRARPPELLVEYGDSDRIGLQVEAVALDPGTLRQGDANTAGGDGATKAPPDKPLHPNPPAAVAPPPAPSPPAVPPPLVVDAPKAETSTMAAPPAPAASDLAASQPLPRTTGAGTAGEALLPGAPGGTRLPLGTPSAGGRRVGSLSGVRLASGVRPPIYPPEAREEGLEGTPVIWLRISAEGLVLEARVQKSCGYKVLDDAALNWARAQKYIPACRDGEPVAAEVTNPVRFYLY